MSHDVGSGTRYLGRDFRVVYIKLKMPKMCAAALYNGVNDPENNISFHHRFLNLCHKHQSHGHFEHVILVISGRGQLKIAF